MHVAKGITPAELVNAIALAIKENFIFFSDEDLLPHEGSQHNLPLYITVGWGYLLISTVLIDNGAGREHLYA
ncbi:hypothetical protein BVC80_8111g7 [Macleaya cordata]|uniref:Uncharacterized protein n=1 Tax=Macleaya cordata TaxID=56857 RepID=A0A200PYA4_MACCD|nr:hypothetical protein BVC80_8111g7 [Macleaya cordata]